MDLERINPAELARPSGFSHAVSVPAGRMVFLAGQIGLDRAGSSRRAAWCRSSSRPWPTCKSPWPGRRHPSDLVSVTIYLTDVADYQARGQEIGAVWRRAGRDRVPGHGGRGRDPVVAARGVVEIQGIAVVSAGGVSR